MATKIRPKINQNCTDFSFVQHIETMLACIVGVFAVGEFKYANKNFKGAKGVTMATKFTHTKTNPQISVLYAI